MPRMIFTAVNDGLYTTIRTDEGFPVAYAKNGHYLLAAITSAIAKNGDALVDGATGVYLAGNLDELLREGA